MTNAKQNIAWRWATLLFFLGTGFLMLMTFNDYGVSWDEYFRWRGGEAKYEYYQALFAGDSEEASRLRGNTDHYPGFFDLNLALARRVLPLDLVATGHLGTALFGFVGLLSVYMIGRNVCGPPLGLLAAVLLALTPRYWGHQFINPKDIPFAATFALAMYALIRVVGRPALMNWRTALVFGFAAGACLSVRIGGMLLFCYAGLFLGIQALVVWLGQDRRWQTLFRETRRLICWLLIAAVPAFLMLIAYWPNAHRNPFSATADTLSMVTSFGWSGKALYRGELLGAGEIPWDYLPAMLGMGLPDLWFFVLASALLVLLLTRGKALVDITYSREMAVALALLFAAIFPVAYIVYKGSVVYDGLRHVLFIVPMLAVLIAIVTAWIWNQLKQISRRLGMAWLVILAIMALFTSWESIRLHPYEYAYFNRLSGGLAAVGNQYDVDYWGTAYREAVDIMLADVQANDLLAGQSRPVRVAMLPPKAKIFERYESIAQPPMAMVVLFLPDGFELVDPDANPDYYLGIRRFGFADMLPGETVGEVTRDGLEFARVTRMNP
ncbi:glycosyltransferase family 39 protein [Cerasicoccus arenae]|uniref:Glycosyltransferase RgtA/B/C/D-like domain-containing protein n=1 Tax=Cerasicoccus arenae TaxID=424488 RepID=A0A8J3DCU3_9BACT|nr:glycosyltransferase family 39 protein [Cerasicoccus arenae]MBK1858067.1 glycosyltransferase family 39 protein [Cerasicoccus arenae]GHC06868.1 hypothetical protein GCM10007047_24900 [Cerasicoccus arenae]